MAWYLNSCLGLGWASRFAEHSTFQEHATHPMVFEYFMFHMLESHYGQVHVVALSIRNMLGTHHTSTLISAMNCAQHVANLLVLALGLAHTMPETTAQVWNYGSNSCTSSGFCRHQLAHISNCCMQDWADCQQILFMMATACQTSCGYLGLLGGFLWPVGTSWG